MIVEEGYDPVYGARPLKRTLQRRVLDPLALGVLQGEFREGDAVHAGVEQGHLVLTRQTPAGTMSPEPENRTPAQRPPRMPLRRPISPIWFVAALFGVLRDRCNLVRRVVRQGKTIDYSDFKSLRRAGPASSSVELGEGHDHGGTYTGGDGAP